MPKAPATQGHVVRRGSQKIYSRRRLQSPTNEDSESGPSDGEGTSEQPQNPINSVSWFSNIFNSDFYSQSEVMDNLANCIEDVIRPLRECAGLLAESTKTELSHAPPLGQVRILFRVLDARRGDTALTSAFRDAVSRAGGMESMLNPKYTQDAYVEATSSTARPRSISSSGRGLELLWDFVAAEAVHDSGERFPEPVCHPGTRTSVLEDLCAWSRDTGLGSTILWFHGVAGIGKSAIAQTFAEECKEAGRLGASFFFKRGDPERGTWNRLFTTLAYQLTQSVDGLSAPLQHAVEKDRFVTKGSMERQFQKLIVGPFQQLPTPEIIPVIIIDGLDECEDRAVQQRVLRLLISSTRVHQLPVRIFIASRPEAHLREVLESEAVGISRPFELLGDFKAIRDYFVDKFSEIRSQFSAEVDQGMEWPSPSDVEQLVQKSSGTFIYASTVIGFVSDPFSHPETRLRAVLALDPKSTTPLDDLYSEILSGIPCDSTSLCILYVLWRGFRLDPEELDILLDFPRGTTRRVLRGLHSLLNVPPKRPIGGFRMRIEILHASFDDYLGSVWRSEKWCVSHSALQTAILRKMVHILSSPLPPQGLLRRFLYCVLIEILPRELLRATPTEWLFDRLRNPILRDNLFRTPIDGWGWLYNTVSSQNQPSFPPDLIQFWGNLAFVFNLTRYSSNHQPINFSPSQFDGLYREVFSRQTSADSLFIFSTAAAASEDVHKVMEIYDLSYEIFEPFLTIRQHLFSPLSQKDSPVEFLKNLFTAIELPCLTYDSLCCRYSKWRLRRFILCVQRFLNGEDCFVDFNLLRGIKSSCPVPKLVEELYHLDVIKIFQARSAGAVLYEDLNDLALISNVCVWAQESIHRAPCTFHTGRLQLTQIAQAHREQIERMSQSWENHEHAILETLRQILRSLQPEAETRHPPVTENLFALDSGAEYAILRSRLLMEL